MSPRRICVVSGSRADYGLLLWPMRLIDADPAFDLQVALTGMHLASAFGDTGGAVEADGFQVAARVETLLAGDDGGAVAKAIGLGAIGFADTFSALRPDLVMVLGDRFEIFAASTAAYALRLPIAHLCGGDVTEGVLDEGFRHSISKMASLHFVTNQAASDRLAHMGEPPDRIILAGSPGIDTIRRTELLDPSEIESVLGFTLRPRNLLVTFHPETRGDPAAQIKALLDALDALGPDIGLILTLPNADAGGRGLGRAIASFVVEHENACYPASLGSLRYLSTMAAVDAVVGNSSSGLYEAPSLKVPTVNIGDRQKGRPRAASVIDCPPDKDAILAAIRKALTLNCSAVVNPYGDGYSSERILATLKRIPDFATLVRKPFFEPQRL